MPFTPWVFAQSQKPHCECSRYMPSMVAGWPSSASAQFRVGEMQRHNTAPALALCALFQGAPPLIRAPVSPTRLGATTRPWPFQTGDAIGRRKLALSTSAGGLQSSLESTAPDSPGNQSCAPGSPSTIPSPQSPAHTTEPGKEDAPATHRTNPNPAQAGQ